MYYLRWNPNGNYDSDDDWWNDAVASKGKGRKKNRKREERVKAAAARVLADLRIDPGLSLDITTCDEFGNPFDFTCLNIKFQNRQLNYSCSLDCGISNKF